MNLNFKKLKIVEALSEETTCFVGDLYDGDIFLSEVSNRGHGGGNEWSNYEAEQKVEAYAKTLPRREWDVSGMPDGMDPTYQPDAETLVADALSDYLDRQALTNLMKKSVVAYNTIHEKIFYYDTKPKTRVTPERLKKFRDHHADRENSILLNDMPFEEAYALFRQMS